MTKTISDSLISDNLSSTFCGTYIQIRDRWKYTARISEIIEMIKYTFEIEDWDILDSRMVNNGELEGILVDKLIEYRDNKPVDFKEVWEIIKKYLNFSYREVNLLESGFIDERLWAIFTVLINPSLNINY